MNCASMADFAALIVAALPRKNPDLPATIRDTLPLANGTPMVLVELAGYLRPALFAVPRPIQIGGAVWVARFDGRSTAPLYVVATNYQGSNAPLYAAIDDNDTAFGSGPYGAGEFGR